MNQNGYVGRTYLEELNKKRLYDIDVISIGSYPEISNIEEQRCSGLWRPLSMDEVVSGHRVVEFDSLQSTELLTFLKEEKYDYLIQGGTGIIKKELIDCIKEGILNFHPGDLPTYRGCSAPEWQIIEKKPIVCTCHLLDDGIDTGAIYKKNFLDVSLESYYAMRSTVYPQIAKFLSEVIEDLEISIRDRCYIQDESQAIYRKYIGDDRIEWLIENWDDYLNDKKQEI